MKYFFPLALALVIASPAAAQQSLGYHLGTPTSCEQNSFINIRMWDSFEQVDVDLGTDQWNVDDTWGLYWYENVSGSDEAEPITGCEPNLKFEVGGTAPYNTKLKSWAQNYGGPQNFTLFANTFTLDLLAERDDRSVCFPQDNQSLTVLLHTTQEATINLVYGTERKDHIYLNLQAMSDDFKTAIEEGDLVVDLHGGTSYEDMSKEIYWEFIDDPNDADFGKFIVVDTTPSETDKIGNGTELYKGFSVVENFTRTWDAGSDTTEDIKDYQKYDMQGDLLFFEDIRREMKLKQQINTKNYRSRDKQ